MLLLKLSSISLSLTHAFWCCCCRDKFDEKILRWFKNSALFWPTKAKVNPNLRAKIFFSCFIINFPKVSLLWVCFINFLGEISIQQIFNFGIKSWTNLKHFQFCSKKNQFVWKIMRNFSCLFTFLWAPSTFITHCRKFFMMLLKVSHQNIFPTFPSQKSIFFLLEKMNFWTRRARRTKKQSKNFIF